MIIISYALIWKKSINKNMFLIKFIIVIVNSVSLIYSSHIDSIILSIPIDYFEDIYEYKLWIIKSVDWIIK